MIRSPNAEMVERINMALALLRKSFSNEKITAVLVEQYGVSKRQAYRYIQEAQKTKRELPIPEQKEVFTVKLPVSLVFRIRRFAKSTGDSISDIVTRSLELFLKRRGHG